jgi:hypothetical protein
LRDPKQSEKYDAKKRANMYYRKDGAQGEGHLLDPADGKRRGLQHKDRLKTWVFSSVNAVNIGYK